MRKLHLLIGLVFICEQCFGDSEYIVRYNGYFDETKRQEILKELNLIPAEKRKTQLSDFDVIESNAFDFSKHSLIRDIQLCNNSSTIKLSAKQFGPPQRRRPGLDILNVAKQIRADKLWARGFTGSSIKVAIFDSGLTPNRVHFKNVAAERDFTDESLPSDQVGHGTFVAGVIAGNNRKCPGISPNSELYIYKVFTKNQESKTKWFLDAFNDALQQKVHIINLSIGGSDYLDKLFMQKMEELISNGIIIVSAVGNDGPTFGSINNPADYTSVIGVGAINSDLHLARFSSRGLTTSEFPAGYGRVKPDIVTFGVQLRAAARNGGCRLMSGTSVATPLISGAIALLLSSMPPEKRNSMQIIQALHSGAERLNGLSIMEQGAGRFDLLNSFAALHSQRPQITFFPPYLDMSDCSYMWPYCSQPLYTTGMPLIVNISMHSGFNSSVMIKRIRFECNENKSLIDISVEHSSLIERAGFLSLFITANKHSEYFNGSIEGQLNVEFVSKYQQVNVTFPIRLNLISTPPKSRRILWDQYRNLYYPSSFLPRDDLLSNKNPLDWHIDHPHTNFLRLYKKLRDSGFFVEISGHPLTCTDLSNYGTVLVVDPEDEYYPQELHLIDSSVRNGLNLIVVGDWYNERLLASMKFEDSNSKEQTCYPDTGGSNLPALNDLVGRFGFAFGDQVLDGKANLFNTEIRIASGAQLRASSTSAWISTANLNNMVTETMNKTKDLVENAAIFGLDWPTEKSGLVAVFGDSNCFETNECGAILIELLNMENTNDYWRFGLKKSNLNQLPLNDLPNRMTKSNFAKISRVASKVYKTHITSKIIPDCFPKELIENVNLDVKISFDRTDELEQLRTIAREYFKKPNSNQSDILKDSSNSILDYADYDPEMQAKNVVQYYTYRFFHFISVIALISFICFTLQNKLRAFLFKPLIRLLSAFV